MKRVSLSLLFIFLCSLPSSAQRQRSYNSDQIYKKIQKLNFLGSVLYVGAHPDDENTAMISYLSNVKRARVAYLAMTRGDGGQNIIGSEMRELLGVIRTEELLAARQIDGGSQFFTRANDFGYSKNPEETFEFWDKDQIMSDVVWVIRKFRPDVIINRFDHRTSGDTHGHHTASAILSAEAFELAGKKDVYPNQLTLYDAWQPSKFYLNISWLRFGHPKQWKKADKSKYHKMDLGTYLPIKGLSNTEIAAHSRSQHKSQGFGVADDRGSSIDYLEPIKGQFSSDQQGIFDGIVTSWERIKGGEEIGQILTRVQDEFNFKEPAASIPKLLEAYELINKLDNKHWRELKLSQIKEVIAACAGLYLEASSSVEFGTLGQTVEVDFEAINRSNIDIELKNIRISNANDAHFSVHKTLANNKDVRVTKDITIPEDLEYSSPYWLHKPHSAGMYKAEKQELIGLPESPPQLVATFQMTINSIPINFDRTLIYKKSDPVKGEVNEPFAIVPELSLSMRDKTLIFAADSAQEVEVEVKAFSSDVSGRLMLKLPDEWEAYPKEYQINKKNIKHQTMTYTFTVTPPDSQDEGYIYPEFVTGNKAFTDELHIINYPHIPTQTVLLPAKTKMARLDIKTIGHNIAYIEGAGDMVPQSLRAIGYQVDVLAAKDMSLEKLKSYDAVVVGIRAYDVNEDLIRNQDTLFDYIKEGGTVVNQYNTTRELKTNRVAPYELQLSHDRVTEEDSEVEFLAPNHPVLNRPNKITKKDFDGWVQERGLYFPDQWSDKYSPVLGMHDRGEDQNKSSILVAKYGNGYFVYTGLSFFRELPAGVAGAYRLFANLLALGK